MNQKKLYIKRFKLLALTVFFTVTLLGSHVYIPPTAAALNDDQVQKLAYLEAFRNAGDSFNSATCRGIGKWRGDSDGKIGRGDLVDTGSTRGITGIQIDPGAGVRNCGEVFKRTMGYVAQEVGVEASSDLNYQALYILLARRSTQSAIDTYESSGTSYDPWANSSTIPMTKELETQFMRDHIDPLISELSAPSPTNIYRRVEKSFDVCFRWEKGQDSSPFGGNSAINDTENKYYARYTTNSDYPDSNPLKAIQAVLPDYTSGSALTNRQKDKLRDVLLEFEADSSGRGPENDGNWDVRDSQWYPYGSDIRKVIGFEAANNGNDVHQGGIINCQTIAQKLYPLFKEVLQVNENGTTSVKGSEDPSDPDAGGDDDAEEGELPGCEGGSLDWVVCPVVNGLSKLADTIVEQFLQPILRVQILELPSNQSDAQSQALYGAWKGFRNIANALMILALLAIIISTAFSEE